MTGQSTHVAPPSIFDSFNARNLSARQVAETFVPSAKFAVLSRRAHTLILGPRGSGKTTLLKMLQPEALSQWKGPQAAEIAAQIDFTGVFVASDVGWGKQLASLGGERLDPEARNALSSAAFTNHALRALVIAFKQRVLASGKGRTREFRAVGLTPEAEAHAVQTIATALRLGTIAPSLDGLQTALTARNMRIGEIANRETILGPDGWRQRLADRPELTLPLIGTAALAIEAFENAAGIPPGKWAYLFDELEIAPDPIRKGLMDSLRSTDDRFLLKLALNPFESDRAFSDFRSAMLGQDFEEVRLWYPERTEAVRFCADLWDGIARGRNLGQVSAAQAFGQSAFSSETEPGVGGYSRGSRAAKRFDKLRKRDASFAEYLRTRNLDPLNLDRIPEAERAATVRKISSVVAVREFYWRGIPSDPPRTRKNAELFTGRDSVFAVTEGNPRWFIGIVNNMLLRAPTPFRSIPKDVQADELQKGGARFAAAVRTQAMGNSEHTVIELVRKLGKYLHDQTVRGPFKPEPPGSFTVDSDLPAGLLDTVGQAANCGAMIYVPSNDSEQLLSSPRGKRFRLSYLFAPIYGFPVRLGKPISLRTALGSVGHQDKQGILGLQNDEEGQK